MLNKRQFAKLAQEATPTGPEDAGFTVKHTTGYRPSKGYAVALAGTERDMPVSQMSGEALQDYAEKHNESLSTRGRYLGAWSPGQGEPSHGRSYLDNTRIIRNRNRAVNEMVMENQQSIWDLNRNEPVHNVFRQKPETFEEPAGFEREKFERDVADLYRSAARRRTLSAEEASRREGAR